MIKDQLFKRLFIPIFGAAFFFIHVMGPGRKSFFQLTGGLFFFIAVSFLAWQGIAVMASRLQMQDHWQETIAGRLALLVSCSAVFTGGLFFLSHFLWQKAVLSADAPNDYLQGALFSGFTGAMLALFMDNAFLSREKMLDSRVLRQLDKEREGAERKVVQNEMDPHFFFNCMNTLSYLVRNDGEKAHQFVHKLSSVYKYFLRNKEKDYVALEDELEFLENYHYLLRIRFDNNIRIENSITRQENPLYILPCSLQVLVENAMKNNFFSEKDPLVVSIMLEEGFVIVTNRVTPKPHAPAEANIGLRSLQARYRLLTNQHIQVQQTKYQIFVKLPLVKTISDHDKSSDN